MNKTENVYLCKMTKGLNRQFWRDFCYDPFMFRDRSKLRPYVYSEDAADASLQRQIDLKRVHLAVMLNSAVIGEIILKNIDLENRTCTMGIHLQNDSVKNRGYGTAAERLALEYAFSELKLRTVFADSLHQNKRSQRVLEKVGFIETHRDEEFRYYRRDRTV